MLYFVSSVVASATTFDELAADPLGVLLADRHTPGGFRMIALSHTAEACLGRWQSGLWEKSRAVACADAVASAALDVRLSPYGAPIREVGDLGNHGLLLSHLAVVLGVRDVLHPEACDAALHDRIAAHLEALALASDAGVGPSYPSSASRWPADQAATLYALRLSRDAHAIDHLSAPLARYLAWLPADRLPRSELTGSSPDADLPRGSAIAFTVRYLASVSPLHARDLWTRAVEEGFVVDLGPLVALREWPPGVERAPDIDSGPIVEGLGASATAFGQAAAAAIGDSHRAKGLHRTATLGGQLVGAGLPTDVASSALAVAIAAQAELRSTQAAPQPPR